MGSQLMLQELSTAMMKLMDKWIESYALWRAKNAQMPSSLSEFFTSRAEPAPAGLSMSPHMQWPWPADCIKWCSDQLCKQPFTPACRVNATWREGDARLLGRQWDGASRTRREHSRTWREQDGLSSWVHPDLDWACLGASGILKCFLALQTYCFLSMVDKDDDGASFQAQPYKAGSRIEMVLAGKLQHFLSWSFLVC